MTARSSTGASREEALSKEESLLEGTVFPLLEEVVASRAIRQGLEWAYIRGQSISKFQKQGWKMVPSSQPFEAGGESWVVMVQGEPILGSAAFVPIVLHEVVAP